MRYKKIIKHANFQNGDNYALGNALFLFHAISKSMPS